MARKKPVSLAAAVERFVAGLRLSGAEQIRAELARGLAESFEEAPAYARPRLASELRALIGELEEAEHEQPNAPRLVQGVAG